MNRDLVKSYKKMYKIRAFEEILHNIISNSALARYNHYSVGREAVAVAVSECFLKGDNVVNTYRTHGIALALGMEPKDLLEEILMDDNENKNLNGSMYVTSFNNGMISTNTIIGAGLPISVGLSWGKKLNNEDSVIWCIFGDGAALSGAMHEALNTAAKHCLPIVFICENNNIALCTPFDKVGAMKSIDDLASSYGIIGEKVDGRDFIGLQKVIERLSGHVRKGYGPVLIEVDVPQLGGHSAFDRIDFNDFSHFDDPIKVLEKRILSNDKTINIKKIQENVYQELKYLKRSYEDFTVDFIPLQQKTNGNVTFQEAINKSLDSWLEEDKSTILLGASIERLKLYKKYGPNQVLSLPITENSNVGIAYGFSLLGRKVIVDLMNAAFLFVAMDQIINTLAMTQFQYPNLPPRNVLIKCLIGNGIGMGPQQAHNPHGLFMQIPGLKIVYPSTPNEASGLLKYIKENNTGPVIFFEHLHLRPLLGREGEVFPIGKASIKKVGTDITVITVGAMVHVALEAGNELEKTDNIKTEIIDLVSLSPLDKEAIINSVTKTGRVIVIDEAWPTAGLSDHIISLVCKSCSNYLKYPPVAINLPERGVPASPKALTKYIPNTKFVVQKIIEAMEGYTCLK